MFTIQEIEKAISKLSKRELASFRKWFEKFDAEVWDKQFENDVKSGKLDKLGQEGVSDYKAGKCKEL